MSTMRFFRAIINTVVFSNIYISIVAMVMYMDIVNVAGMDLNKNIQGILFHGTLLVYSIHWFFNWNEKGKSERMRWNRKYKWLIGVLGICAAIGLVRYLLNEIKLLPYLIAPGVLIVLYEMRMLNQKVLKFRLYGKTLIVTITWMYATSLMPFLYHPISFDIKMITAIGMQTCVVYLAALLFDKRDADGEKQFHLLYNNIEYFKLSLILVDLLTLIFFMSALVTHQAGLFHWGKLVAMLFLNGTIKYSLRSRSDYWYYGVIDGAMGLPIGLLGKGFVI